MKITVASSENCGACVALKRALEEKRISYTELDVEKDYKELTKLKVPIGGLPTTIIEEQGSVIDVYTGFSGIKLTEWEMMWENQKEI